MKAENRRGKKIVQTDNGDERKGNQGNEAIRKGQQDDQDQICESGRDEAEVQPKAQRRQQCQRDEAKQEAHCLMQQSGEWTVRHSDQPLAGVSRLATAVTPFRQKLPAIIPLAPLQRKKSETSHLVKQRIALRRGEHTGLDGWPRCVARSGEVVLV